eukprot:468588_1
MNLFKEQSPSNRSTKHACNWGPRSAGIKHPAHSNIIPQKRSLEIPIKKTHSKQPNHPRKKRKILHHIQNNNACNNTDAIRWQIHLKQRTAVECVRPTLNPNTSIHTETIKHDPLSSMPVLNSSRISSIGLISDSEISDEDDAICNPNEATETHTTPITSNITADTVHEGAWMFSLCVEEVFRTRAATAGEIIPMIKVITTNKSKLLFHERCDQMVWFQRRGTMPRMYCQCIKNNTYQTLSSEDVDLRFVSPNRNRKKKELILFRKQLNRQKPVFINPNVFDGKYVIGLKVLAVLEPFGKQYSLFVFHLPDDIDDHGLLQLFASYGAMRSKVMRHDMGRSRGFGFVHFNTRHEAQIAIDRMNGHKIGRKRLRVSFTIERNVITQ